MTASMLGKELEEAGIIESSRLFIVQERVSDYAGKYVPGTYYLSSEMTTEEILRVISGTEVSRFAPKEEQADAAQEETAQ